MADTDTPNRCRIVLIAPPAEAGGDDKRIVAALSGGDVASLILPAYDQGEDAFQRRAEMLVPAAQARGVAVMIAGEARVAHRVGADGLHIETSAAELAEAIEKNGQRMMVGCGGAKTRDDALALGETQPAYIFFGRFGYDTKPEPHNRNLTLGRWWTEMIRIPCIVMAGAETASVATVAETGVEFVALSQAIFAEADPVAAVARANALLDETAPRLEG